MQEVKIYNSLKNKIEVFKPIEEGKVSIYVCGPTVYGNLHIGNARPIAVFDIFVKALRKMGYEVTYMSNVTDIDDKIIRKAIEEGISEKEVAEKLGISQSYISRIEKKVIKRLKTLVNSN